MSRVWNLNKTDFLILKKSYFLIFFSFYID